MARFQFRLRTLLRIREAARDERRAQLAEAYAAQQTLEARRAELEADLEHQQQHFRAGVAPGRIDVDRLLTSSRYEAVIRAEVEIVVRHERDLAEEIERRRQALVAAEREVRVLEKLRDRQWEQFQVREAAAEMKVLDEIAARTFVPEEVSR